MRMKRFAWLMLVVLMLAAGSGLLAYILCALIMPEDPNKYIEI